MCFQERDATIERYKIEKDREIRILQNSWNEEQARLNRELEKLQKRLESVPDEIAKATRGVRQVKASTHFLKHSLRPKLILYQLWPLTHFFGFLSVKIH